MLRTISAILLVICMILCFITNDLIKQVKTFKANEKALLNSAESYRVNDSLSAAHINQLQLSLLQFENTAQKTKLSLKLYA